MSDQRETVSPSAITVTIPISLVQSTVTPGSSVVMGELSVAMPDPAETRREFEARLEEYKTLRAEILNHQSAWQYLNQWGTSVGVAASAVIVVANPLFANNLQKAFMLAFLGFVYCPLLLTHAYKRRKLYRIGRYIECCIEPFLSGLHWETIWKRGPGGEGNAEEVKKTKKELGSGHFVEAWPMLLLQIGAFLIALGFVGFEFASLAPNFRLSPTTLRSAMQQSTPPEPAIVTSFGYVILTVTGITGLIAAYCVYREIRAIWDCRKLDPDRWAGARERVGQWKKAAQLKFERRS